jgi:hypothetical protein
LKVIGEQLSKLVEKGTVEGKAVLLEELDELFMDEHGFQLRPETCESESIEDLILDKLQCYLKV